MITGKSLCCHAPFRLFDIENDAQNHRTRALQECTKCGLVAYDEWLPIPPPLLPPGQGLSGLPLMPYQFEPAKIAKRVLMYVGAFTVGPLLIVPLGVAIQINKWWTGDKSDDTWRRYH